MDKASQAFHSRIGKIRRTQEDQGDCHGKESKFRADDEDLRGSFAFLVDSPITEVTVDIKREEYQVNKFAFCKWPSHGVIKGFWRSEEGL